MTKKLTSYQEAALKYDKHISLTANAGSGKTFVLSRRYVDIAVNEKVNLNNIIAITFTDKAAGELYKKIADEIKRRFDSTKMPYEKKRLEMIRRQLVSANISTIHSFCTSILREFPVEACIDANFQALDKNAAQELIDICTEDVLNNFIKSENNEEIKELIRFFGSKKIFEKEIKNLVHARKKIQKLSQSLYIKDETEIAKFFRNKYDDIERKILHRYEEIVNDIREINKIVLSAEPQNQIAVDIDYELNEFTKDKQHKEKIGIIKNILELMLTKDGKVKTTGYLKKGVRENCEEEILRIEEFSKLIKYFGVNENSDENELELAAIGKKLITIQREITGLYEKIKFKKGCLDFEDLLIYALKIVNNKNVKEYLSSKYKYIMVDEFQDTNEIQYDIIMPILDHLKKNNLFIVGDEKQSIYMFRDAELKIFNRTKEEIRSNNGTESILTLPHSFRVAPQIALLTNKLFSNLLNNPKEIFNEVGASELICAKKEDEPGGVELLIASKDGISETELVAKKILNIVKDSEISFGDITILCRKRKDFLKLEEAFARFKIPSAIVDGKGFFQRQIIFDILNYLKFLMDSNNDASLIGVLRSPFFMLSDTELLRINLERGQNFFEKLNKFAEKNNSVKKVLNELDYYRSIAKKIPINNLIRDLLVESGYWTIIAAKQNGEQEIANLEKLISASIKFSKNSFKSLYDFIEYLENSIDENEDEGQAQISSGENSVKIMTLHKAKGLEFKVVFLFNSNTGVNSNGISAKSLFIDNEYGILTKVPFKKNYFSDYEDIPLNGAVNYIHWMKELAETKRLLYVGITRAVNYLFISAKVDKGCKNGSFIDLVQKGLDLDLESSEYEIISKLKFLKNTDGENKDIEKNFKLVIPIVREVEWDGTNTGILEQTKSAKQILLDEINDDIKHEFISATKLSIFNQCPVKYELNYEYGYSRLFNMFNESAANFEFENRISIEEKDEKLPANIKGLIVHKALEICTDYAECEMKIDDIVNKEISGFEHDKETVKVVTKKVLSDLKIYYSSKSFNEIKSFSKYENEFEVYAKEGSFYLYGIIDRIIIDENTLIIVDYKTDEVDESELDKKAENYLTQLKFYAYTLSKIFENISSYKLWLSFIKAPDKIIKWEFSKAEIMGFKKLIENYIEKTVSLKFQADKSHCRSCNFFVDNYCVKDKYAEY